MRYSPHGFVTLEFDGDNAWETYYTPDHIALTPGHSSSDHESGFRATRRELLRSQGFGRIRSSLIRGGIPSSDRHTLHHHFSKEGGLMPRYVLVNRRAGKFTTEQKHASRAAVAMTLASFQGSSRIVSDKNPTDELARRVVVFDADASRVASMQASLPPDAVLEPLIRAHSISNAHRVAAVVIIGGSLSPSYGFFRLSRYYNRCE